MRWIILSLFFSRLTLAGLSELRLGEQDAGLYYGPLAPQTTIDPITFRPVFLDHIFEENPYPTYTQYEVFELAEFWENFLRPSFGCSNVQLNRHFPSLDYLSRILAISYLESYLVSAQKDSYHLNGKRLEECQTGPDFLVRECAPKDPDLGLFAIRSRFVLGRDINWSEFVQYFGKEKDRFLQKFGQSFHQKLCPNCDLMTDNGALEAIDRTCKWAKSTIKELCSNQGNLGEIRQFNRLYEVLSESNALFLINQEGEGKACLARYSKIGIPQETKQNSTIEQLMEFSFQVNKSNRYKEGDLFLAGALKEFDQKGIKDFLFTIEKARPVKKIIAISNPPMVEKITVPPMPVPIKKSPDPKAFPKIEAPTKSAFESALEILKSENSDVVSVDMKKMNKDYNISQAIIKDLEPILQKFYSRKALKELRDFDGFGKREAPLQLFFLRYLIEKGDHHGLFNIIAIVGEKFYVKNDIENINLPVLIHLRNDEESKFQWQIDLLGEKGPVADPKKN